MDLAKIFEKVRDIPYSIPLGYGKNDNCCSGKSDKLFKLLTKSGYIMRYRVCVFLWNSLLLPKKVMGVPHDPDCTHTYLEIKLNGKWKIVDATWDNGLKKIFPINHWDSKSNTGIAVTPIKIFTPKKNLRIVKNQNKKVIEDDLSRNREFYTALNEWLTEVRSKL